MRLSVAALEILIEGHEAAAHTARTQAKAWSVLLELKYSKDEAVYTLALKMLQEQWDRTGAEPTYSDVAFAIANARSMLHPVPQSPVMRRNRDNTD